MKKLPKNQDMTRLINFRLRVSDCEKLDMFASTNNMSRTAAIEKLITTAAECRHQWVSGEAKVSPSFFNNKEIYAYY